MEKRVFYSLVVMIMYLVGGGYSQGVVKRIRDKAEWEEILADADHYIGVLVTSPLCGAPCTIVEGQVARFVDDFGLRIRFFTANIWQFLKLEPFLVNILLKSPTVIVFKDGNVIIQYEDLLDWGNLYDLLFGSVILDPAPGPSFSEAGADLPPPPQTG
ncbi:hypothetical protein HA466_0311100 [Hirschfeldia incana]|nr:hypothetical protein HA466_0311100 [Hirschfeldia incana]